ncbi:MAG TPA: DUF1064 domain-containing protein [Methanoregulaceae archaeon]|nr:DUF1064 domain-containing protein [Methanoregulaceae archaeon]
MTTATFRRQVGGVQGRQPRIPTVVDGIEFTSKTEAAFFGELVLLRKAGIITAIECHPFFDFQEKFTNARGIKRGRHRYTADFRVTYASGDVRVFEVKAAPHMIPQDFKLRRDATEALFGIAVWTVYTSNRRWIDVDTKKELVWS